MVKRNLILAICFLLILVTKGQYILQPDRVFDGKEMHEGWVVAVEKNKITQIGPAKSVKIKGAETIDLKGTTLMPGMIEGHSHMLLYPYDQTPWNDQVLKESESFRAIRGVVHAEKTLLAGVTFSRDLGSEGAGYADVGLKRAIQEGVIPGPRLIVAGPAIVATGSYGPTGFSTEIDIHKGAEVADGANLIETVRNQIGRGADFIKVYADYRWGPDGTAQPTFTLEELTKIVEVAELSGRYVIAHAATADAMQLAALAGVETIEHGQGGTKEVFELMKSRGVALCPTLAAGEAISMYRGWEKGKDPDPARVTQAKNSFALALESGISIVAGGDVGVYEHGTNVREFLLMKEYGMTNLDVLKSITSGNAEIFHWGDRVGNLKPGYLADIIAVKGNPLDDLKALESVEFVMKDGDIYKQKP